MHIHSLSALALAFAGALLLRAAGAQGITVGPPGSGAMFTSIQAAVDAASPGGLVLVAPGSYSELSTLTIDKGLTLLGAGSSSTSFTAISAPGGLFQLPLRITGLAASEQVTVIGLQLLATPGAGLVSHGRLGFDVANCAGPVVLSDLVVGTVWGYSGGNHATACSVSNAANVTIDRCRVDATTQVPFGVTTVPTALRVFRSLVHVNASSLFGSLAPNGAQAIASAPGIHATESTLRIARSEIRGGDGRSTNGSGGAAVFVDAASLVSTAADVVAIAGRDINGQTTTPAIAGGGLQAPFGVPLPTIAVATPLVAPGGTLDFGVHGEPLAVVATLLAAVTTTGYSQSGVLGLFTIDPSHFVVLAIGVLNGNGAAAAQLSVPPAPTLAGLVVHAQALSFAPNGPIVVSGPTAVAVR